MSPGRIARLARENGVAVAVALAVAGGVALGIRFVRSTHDGPPPRKVVTITGVLVKPEPPPPKPPPPPQQVPPKVEEHEPLTRMVEVKASDVPPPEGPRPEPSAPAAGPLALAGEASGEGDAFNLAGNPGGRSLLGPGGLGDGAGDGVGEGGEAGSRYGWYFGQIGAGIEEAFRRIKKTSTAQARVEIKVWVDPSGRLTRLQLRRSTGDPELDAAIRSVVGMKLPPPSPDIPMPVVYRFTARRPG